MSDVVIDVTGMALFLSGDNVVVFARALEGRIADDRRTVIPPHLTFLAIPTAAYRVTSSPVRRPNFTFRIQQRLVGAGDDGVDYDVFLLSKETVYLVSSSEELLGSVLDTAIVRMRNVIPGKVLKPGVKEGTHPAVMARLRTDGASASVLFSSLLRFGNVDHRSANTIRFTFKPTESEPTLEIAGAEVTTRLELTRAGVLVMATVPIEELFGMSTHIHESGMPLHHFELLYDFFALLRDDLLPIPTRVAEQDDGGLGPPGKCGPPAGS